MCRFFFLSRFLIFPDLAKVSWGVNRKRVYNKNTRTEIHTHYNKNTTLKNKIFF